MGVSRALPSTRRPAGGRTDEAHEGSACGLSNTYLSYCQHAEDVCAQVMWDNRGLYLHTMLSSMPCHITMQHSVPCAWPSLMSVTKARKTESAAQAPRLSLGTLPRLKVLV